MTKSKSKAKKVVAKKTNKAVTSKTKKLSQPCSACAGSGIDASSGDVKSCTACQGIGLTN